MATLRLTLEYDGTGFKGWARQPGERTVEGVLRDALDAAGLGKVGIVASSGFDPAKCKLMADARAPADVIGTGSFLPQRWTETYATADIIVYNGKPSVKLGREFLLSKWQSANGG